MVTLTANLQSILGMNEEGFVRLTLCGFGASIPAVPGTGVIANAGVPQMIGPGTQVSVQVFGNDVIQPQHTFYEIAVLDVDSNAIQANNYILDGAGTLDLSTITPIVPPYGYPVSALKYLPCLPTLNPQIWTPPGNPIMVFYNGVALPKDVTGRLSYSLPGGLISLSFNPGSGDYIDALCTITTSQ